MLLLLTGGCADDEPRASVATLLPIPSSAKFQSVREQGGYVCGEVNGREAQGGYSGYRRFIYDKSSKEAAIDPRVGHPVEPASAPEPACSKPFAYQTVEERLSCAQGPVQQTASDRQRRFDALWARSCGAQS